MTRRWPFDNVAVLPDGEPFFRFASTPAVRPALIVEPNVVVLEADVADLCFRAVGSGDFSIACDTSLALAGDAASLSSVPATTPSTLPGGYFADRMNRVFDDPPNYGAYQLLYP